jgi:hypothetical protein
MVIGFAVALASFAIFTIGPAAFFAVPLFTGLGIMKGASTFGQIGSTAAIFAEGAELRERRGALLDRLHITQSQQEADEILKTLNEEAKEKPPQKIFHWKSMIVGALIGAAVLSLVAYVMPALLLGMFGKGLEVGMLSNGLGGGAAAKSFLAGLTANLIPISAVVGAVSGATIGVDRHYIRRWFDLSENIVYDSSASRQRSQERQQEAARLSRIAESGELQKAADASPIAITPAPAPAPALPTSIPASTARGSGEESQPKVKVHTTGLERTMLASYEQAMRAPVM